MVQEDIPVSDKVTRKQTKSRLDKGLEEEKKSLLIT
jgi:hypothetical protein